VLEWSDLDSNGGGVLFGGSHSDFQVHQSIVVYFNWNYSATHSTKIMLQKSNISIRVGL
jgi:hypothetical protein